MQYPNLFARISYLLLKKKCKFGFRIDTTRATFGYASVIESRMCIHLALSAGTPDSEQHFIKQHAYDLMKLCPPWSQPHFCFVLGGPHLAHLGFYLNFFGVITAAFLFPASGPPERHFCTLIILSEFLRLNHNHNFYFPAQGPPDPQHLPLDGSYLAGGRYYPLQEVPPPHGYPDYNWSGAAGRIPTRCPQASTSSSTSASAPGDETQVKTTY